MQIPLIISSEQFDQSCFHHIYNIQSQKFERLVLPRQPRIPRDYTPWKQKLPTELGYVILEIAIYDCMMKCDYQKALTLLSVSSKILARFYNTYFRKARKLSTMFLRISSCFKHIAEIHCSYLSLECMPLDPFAILEFRQLRPSRHEMSPWDFESVEVTEMEQPLHPHASFLRSLCTGPTYGHTAWVGVNMLMDFYRSGYICADLFQLPVIPMIFFNASDEIIDPVVALRSYNMIGFVKLLKIPFGPRCAVYAAGQLEDFIMPEMDRLHVWEFLQ